MATTAYGILQQIYESPFNNLMKESPFCMMNSESLQMCTEGLGFESLDGTEELKEDDAAMEVSNVGNESFVKREKRCVTTFPPPISSLGFEGKSSVCFKSYRKDGRFVLEEVRIPKQEYLHASREDGRLRLSFVEDDDDDDEEEEEVCGDQIDEKEEDEGKEVDVIEKHVKGVS